MSEWGQLTLTARRHRSRSLTRFLTWEARGRFLLNRDRRREALDEVDVGLVHQLQELPGVGGQALDVPALALGIQGVERQAGLARTAQPGDHHQLVARDVQVDVLEVVRARPADADALGMQQGRERPAGAGVVAIVRGHGWWGTR